ncbi:MAG: hypothetical protein JST13_04000, partial [Bacteroidetes bacterium]|nr:hypothetical protein [Bacteroidota bacterium]
FLKDFFYDPAKGFSDYTNHLEYYSIAKPLGIFNFFSGGNYYINVIFFDFISVIGLLLLYKLLMKYFYEQKKILIAVLFFLPLPTFWLSGIRAEALLLLCISTALYFTDKFMNHEKKPIYIIYTIAALIECMVLRQQMLAVLLPALFCLALSWQKPRKAIYFFCLFYIIGIVVFFGSIFFNPENNLSIPIIMRQREFLSLHGNTSFKLDSLQPTALSFIKIFPQAFANGFLRPFSWEAKGLLQLFASVDVILFWIFLFASVLFRKHTWKKILVSPLPLFFLFYSFAQIVLIGYVVPFPGAIVRYKSIPEMFLFLAVALLFDFKRLRPKSPNTRK